MTGIIYFIGAGYVEGLFARLGISYHFFDLPTSLYLTAGAVMLWVFLVLTALQFFIDYRRINGRWDLFRRPKAPYVMVLINFIILYLMGKIEIFYLIALLVSYRSGWIFARILIPILDRGIEDEKEESGRRSYLDRLFFGMNVGYLVFIIVSSTGTSYLVANFWGKYAAERLVSGNNGNEPRVKLFVVQDQMNLANRDLGFLAIINQNYYLVEHDSPVPKVPHLFIVPEDRVMAIEFLSQDGVATSTPFDRVIQSPANAKPSPASTP